ncbi:MAG: NAD(P)-dependent oxidoreductase [Dehalococcoidia bacterium]
MDNVGFIGLGNMGLGMANNILMKNKELNVYNRTKSKIDLLNEGKIIKHSSIASIASNCNVLFTCLPDINTSMDVFLGKDGILENSKPESVIVDHSTVDIDTSKLIWEKSLNKSVYFIDAPISGGPEGAKGGSLTIMCGGDSIAFEKIKPILNMMGSSVVHMGGAGTGTTMKLVNQLLTSVNTVASIEALLLADESGIDVKSALSVLKTSFGYSKMVERNVPYFAKKRFENSSAPIRNLEKDLKIILDLSKMLKLELPLTKKSLDIFSETNKLDLVEPDMSAISLYIKELGKNNE